MPWKLVVIAGVFFLFAIFAGFNLAPVDISLGFHVFRNVPVFLALIISFLLGALLAIPLAYRQISKKKKPKPRVETLDDAVDSAPEITQDDEKS